MLLYITQWYSINTINNIRHSLHNPFCRSIFLSIDFFVDRFFRRSIFLSIDFFVDRFFVDRFFRRSIDLPSIDFFSIDQPSIDFCFDSFVLTRFSKDRFFIDRFFFLLCLSKSYLPNKITSQTRYTMMKIGRNTIVHNLLSKKIYYSRVNYRQIDHDGVDLSDFDDLGPPFRSIMQREWCPLLRGSHSCCSKFVCFRYPVFLLNYAYNFSHRQKQMSVFNRMIFKGYRIFILVRILTVLKENRSMLHKKLTGSLQLQGQQISVCYGSLDTEFEIDCSMTAQLLKMRVFF